MTMAIRSGVKKSACGAHIGVSVLLWLSSPDPGG